jgi:hypothetical protein
MLFRFIVLWLTSAISLLAHPQVSPITVEAEFSVDRQYTLRVNLDPRLMLSDQPSTLPAATAEWYLSLDSAGRTKLEADAREYINSTLIFKSGDMVLEPKWDFTAIDGVSNFPLTANSSEAHLLATFTGPLPKGAGDFRLALGSNCTVGLILLNSVAGSDERQPQSLFPGESSRAFPLPIMLAEPEKPQAGIVSKWLAGGGHPLGDHLALVLFLAICLHPRPALAELLVFTAVKTIALVLVVAGWLPHAPFWMVVAYWVSFACTLFFAVFNKEDSKGLLISLAAGGLCHGMNLPHQHLSDGSVTTAMAASGTLFLTQFAVLLALMIGKKVFGKKMSQHSG